MCAITGKGCCIQIFPQYVDLVLQVNKEHVSIAPGAPRVAANACVTVITVECLLLCPCCVAICPTYRVEGGSVARVPKMDTNGLIRTITCARGSLPWDWTVVVCGVGIETAVPASFESDVWIIHRLEVEIVDRAWAPDICVVAVNDFFDYVVNADVEYVPL